MKTRKKDKSFEPGDWFKALAEWFHSKGQGTTAEIACEIRRIKKFYNLTGTGVTAGELSRWVVRARRELEASYGTTLINTRGFGYRVSSPADYAVYTMKWAKRTLDAAHRTNELAPRMDKSYLDQAVNRVFKKYKSDFRELSGAKREFEVKMIEWKKELKKGGIENGKES